MTADVAPASQTDQNGSDNRRRILGLPGRLTTLLVVTVVAMGVATFFGATLLFIDAIEGAPRNVTLFFAGCIALTLVLLGIVAARLWSVFQDRKEGRAGSRMHMRLVGLMSIMSILPAIVAFVFAGTVLDSFSKEFFTKRVREANEVSRTLGNAYLTRESRVVAGDLVRLDVDLQRLEDRHIGLENNPIGFRRYMRGQAELRGMTAIYLLDGNHRVVTRVETVAGLDYALPPLEAFVHVDQGKDVLGRFFYKPLDAKKLNVFYGVLKIEGYKGGYLIGYKAEDPQIVSQLLKVNEAAQANATFGQRLGELRRFFATGFVLLASIILLCAVWLGLFAATAIVSPIRRLGATAGKISDGDLSARVDIRDSDGELGDLARTFNLMTADLETQRTDLLDANQQLDERRAFTEAVLSEVSAGVIGTDADGRITITNTSAAEFLGMLPGRMRGALLADIAPAFKGLAEIALAAKNHSASGQIEHELNGTTRLLNVRISGSELDSGEISYVVTFDDISELISAQRNAAWRDVARRIAHEIKNPLTPIQLSAERLRRKYRHEITTTPEVFERCTDTIIRHVSDIGRMVNEFSSFARMPEPVMARERLREIVKAAIFPFQVSAQDIEFEIDIPDQPVVVLCDGRLLVQACTNLIKNAVEAIEENEATDQAGKIKIQVTEAGNMATINVIDNGKGLPDEERHRLTEPYMTTREKGTGLGLAIVRKVIEDHGGKLVLKNDHSLGKTGACASIVLPLAADDDDQSADDHEDGSDDSKTQNKASTGVSGDLTKTPQRVN